MYMVDNNYIVSSLWFFCSLWELIWLFLWLGTVFLFGLNSKIFKKRKKLEKGLYKATGGLRPKSKSGIAYNYMNSVPMHLSQL